MQIGQARVMYMACTTTICMKLDGDLALDVADPFRPPAFSHIDDGSENKK